MKIEKLCHRIYFLFENVFVDLITGKTLENAGLIIFKVSIGNTIILPEVENVAFS
jgi:hypothetical protein